MSKLKLCVNCGRMVADDLRVTIGKGSIGFAQVTLGKQCNRCGTLYKEAVMTPEDYLIQTTPH